MIEIDEVLEATIASGFSTAQRSWKILRLISSFSTAVSITRSQSASPSMVSAEAIRSSAALRASSVMIFFDDLARQVAVDGRHRRLQAIGGDIVQHHVEAGQRRHMRDAVAHLARADHADFLDHHRHLAISPETCARIRALATVIFA